MSLSLIFIASDKKTENEKTLDIFTIDEANKYISEGQFAKGSMLPKVLSILEFI